jgi:hypothetical protein
MAELPNVVHPRLFTIHGYTFQIVSFYSLTDIEAAKLAGWAYHTYKLPKRPPKTAIRAFCHHDRAMIGAL